MYIHGVMAADRSKRWWRLDDLDDAASIVILYCIGMCAFPQHNPSTSTCIWILFFFANNKCAISVCLCARAHMCVCICVCPHRPIGDSIIIYKILPLCHAPDQNQSAHCSVKIKIN